jgi:hypothetical protein
MPRLKPRINEAREREVLTTAHTIMSNFHEAQIPSHIAVAILSYALMMYITGTVDPEVAYKNIKQTFSIAMRKWRAGEFDGSF